MVNDINGFLIYISITTMYTISVAEKANSDFFVVIAKEVKIAVWKTSCNYIFINRA